MHKRIRQYILLTYIFFFLFILLIGLVMMNNGNRQIVEFLQILSAWTPNLVFLVLFKKIYPQDSRVQFIKNQFSSKVKPQTWLTSLLVMILLFLGTLIMLSLWSKKPWFELVNLSPDFLLWMIFSQLIRGPLGEELGWRGFLFREYLKKHSIVKSGFLIGLIWGFWHLPLWLVSGFSLQDMIIYIISFMVSIVCCSILIGMMYSESENIILPIMMHMLNNYLIGLFIFDILHVLVVFAAFYLLITMVMVYTYKRSGIPV